MRSALVGIVKADMIYAQECLGAESARFGFFGSPTESSCEGAREHIMHDAIVVAAKEVFGEENVAAACCVHFSAGLMGKISMKDAVDQDNALRVVTGLFNDSFALRCDAKGGESSEEIFQQRSAASSAAWSQARRDAHSAAMSVAMKGNTNSRGNSRGRRGPQKPLGSSLQFDEHLAWLRARAACNTATPADPLEEVLGNVLGMLGFSLAAPAESAGDV